MRATNEMSRRGFAAACVVAAAIFAQPTFAAEFPPPKEADWIARDFKFHTGEVMKDLKLHYTTIGEPTGQPVLVLHGTAGSAKSMLIPVFGGELFGPGQPLDATKYFIIIPDAIGHGGSAKPSDSLKTAFPKYDYVDMVDAQYRLVTEALGIKHLRLVIGNSMGGMHAWVWGSRYPDAMDVLVPMASQPSEMSARNWMMRRMLVETVRSDPDYKDGNYTSQPRMMKYASVTFGIATAGGTLAYQTLAPTTAAADAMVDDRLKAPFIADANDFIYQWESSKNYNASADLEKIIARVLVINAADDERNPPETGLMERDLKRIANAKLLLIPASTETRGHLTTGGARFYKQQLQEALQTAPQRAM